MNLDLNQLIVELRKAPQSVRDAVTKALNDSGAVTNAATIETLRSALNWDEIKRSPAATARIARTLRDLRNAK